METTHRFKTGVAARICVCSIGLGRVELRKKGAASIDLAVVTEIRWTEYVMSYPPIGFRTLALNGPGRRLLLRQAFRLERDWPDFYRACSAVLDALEEDRPGRTVSLGETRRSAWFGALLFLPPLIIASLLAVEAVSRVAEGKVGGAVTDLGLAGGIAVLPLIFLRQLTKRVAGLTCDARGLSDRLSNAAKSPLV